jgi:hypothetical protein
LGDSLRGIIGNKIELRKIQAKSDHDLAVERMRREQDRKDNEARARLRMQREEMLVNTRLKLLEMGKDPSLAETLCPPIMDDF